MPAVLRWMLRLGPTNPIVVRLVQGGSTRVRHMLIRTVYLAVLIVVLAVMLLESQGSLTYQRLALNGAESFQIAAYLQLVLICVLAPVFMAGAIAQESNPRTWEVLLTTPLSPVQLVLGHLLGRLFFVLVLLFASLPLFAITQYYGGVRGDSIIRSYAVSATAALLVGSIAVAIAVNRIAGQRAVFAFYVAVITYLAITWVIDQQLQPGVPSVTAMTAINPFLALRALLDPTGYPTPTDVELQGTGALERFWMGSPVAAWFWISSSLSLLLVLLSTFGVRNAGSAEGGTPWYRRVFGLGASGSGTRPARAVWSNPIAWREASARQATLPRLIARWAFIAAGLLWGIGLIAFYHGGAMSHEGFRFALLATITTEMLVVILVAINLSAVSISREREDGTLDLLLTTPISQTDYLNGKLRGLLSYLLPLVGVPIVTMIAASLYVLVGGLGRPDGVISNDFVPGTALRINVPVVLPEAALVFPLTAVAFVAFCVMLGLHWSLRSRGSLGAVVGTVAAVGLFGGVAGLCGWKSAQDLPVVGPVLAALNPIVSALASINPAAAMAKSVGAGGDLSPARIALAVGGAVAALVYGIAVYSVRTHLVRTFDVTVRKLAGNR